MYGKIDKKRLGKLCQERRWKMGFTQSDIAKEIGCDGRSISQFECGNTTSWRILKWYLLNDILTNEILKGVLKDGEI